MIEGFLIVKLVKCNKSTVDKNQQTPTLTADFQIRHGKKRMLRSQILIPSVSLNSYFKLSSREMTKQTFFFLFLIPAVTEKLTIKMSVAELCPPPSFLSLPCSPTSHFVYSSWSSWSADTDCNYQWSKPLQVYLLMLLMYAWHSV